MTPDGITVEPDPSKDPPAHVQSDVTVRSAAPVIDPPLIDNDANLVGVLLSRWSSPPVIDRAGWVTGKGRWTTPAVMVRVPVPVMADPLPRVRVPPANFSVLPAGRDQVPVSAPPLSVLPPPTARVPEPTVTVPALSKRV